MTRKEKAQLEKYTNDLINLDLPMPKAAMKFFLDHAAMSIGRGYEYIDYIETRHGIPLQRIFCVQVFGLGGMPPKIREVGRRFLGGKLLVSGIDGGYMGQPYLPYDSSSAKRFDSGWMPGNCWIMGTNPNNSISRPGYCTNVKKWLKKYPYCGWEFYHGSLTFFEYLKAYLKDPKIELLVKNGYSNFVPSANRLNTKGKNFEEIFGVQQPFAKECLKKGSIKDRDTLKANPWISSTEELISFYRIKEKNVPKDIEFSEKLFRYLVTQKQDGIFIYSDYLRAAERLGYPLDERKYRYPDDLNKAHDETIAKLRQVENAENDKVIKRLSEICSGLAYEKGEYCIFPFTCAEDLFRESEMQHNCVRTYVDRCVKGESYIFFLRRKDSKDQSLVTVELTRDPGAEGEVSSAEEFTYISQAYAQRNTRPDDDALKFLKSWRKKFHLKGNPWNLAAA